MEKKKKKNNLKNGYEKVKKGAKTVATKTKETAKKIIDKTKQTTKKVVVKVDEVSKAINKAYEIGYKQGVIDGPKIPRKAGAKTAASAGYKKGVALVHQNEKLKEKQKKLQIKIEGVRL